MNVFKVDKLSFRAAFTFQFLNESTRQRYADDQSDHQKSLGILLLTGNEITVCHLLSTYPQNQ